MDMKETIIDQDAKATVVTVPIVIQLKSMPGEPGEPGIKPPEIATMQAQIAALQTAVKCPPPPSPNDCHLALVNQGADFPLQTIFTATKAGNYLVILSGFDSLGTGLIDLNISAQRLGGGPTPTGGTLTSPGYDPEISFGSEGNILGLAPGDVQMEIINGDPTYAGGTQKYTVYVDVVYLGG